ncbi:MAG: hypothetical protein WC666_02565 [Candidatus Paceibacterota bacterium]|jgi:hypothetical protein
MDPINQPVPQQPQTVGTQPQTGSVPPITVNSAPVYNSQPSPVNSAPAYNNQPSPVTSPATNISKPKKVGPIIVALIVVLILVIVALYTFASSINKETVPVYDTSAINVPANENQAAVVTPEVVTPVTNTADDLQSLQNDLDASIKGVDSQTF